MTAEPIVAGPGEGAVVAPPAVVEPAVPTAAVPAAPTVPTQPDLPIAPPSQPALLADVPEPPKPSETAPPAAPEPAAPLVAPEPEPIVYQAFAFPEGQQADPELVDSAKELFAADRLPQEKAQKYVDYFTKTAMPKLEAKMAERQQAVWDETNAKWAQEFADDPEVGRNRQDTTLNEARFAIKDIHASDDARKDFLQMAWMTGVGNHKSNIRAWAEVGRRMQQIYDITGTDNWDAAMQKLSEPNAPPPGNPARAANGAGSAADRRYGNRR